jgi:hypothetical protein
MASLNRNYELPKFKKLSRYNREKLGLLWDVKLGALVGTYSKNSKFYPLNPTVSFLSFDL